MQVHRRPVRRYRSLTDREWQWAVEHFELGLLNGSQLAAHFGMSKQGMSAGLKKRDAVKGWRAFETVTELEKQIARNQLRRQRAKDELWQKAMESHAIFAKFIEATLVQGGIDATEITASGMFSESPEVCNSDCKSQAK